jgi:Flp pilus assembly protein TadG
MSRRHQRGALAARRERSHRGRDERGSTVLEMAIVATVLFGLLLGLVTFALVQASDNAGTNAAREGARAAALNVVCADAYPTSTTLDSTQCPTTPSTAYDAVVTAVTSKLGGLLVGTPSVAVTCLAGSSTPLATEPCDNAVVPDVDLVRVTVTWAREATNPISHTSTHSDSATVTVEGSGKGTSDSSACQATASVSPTTAALAAPTGPSYLANGTTVVVTVYTNGYCATPLSIGFNTGVTSPSEQMSLLPDGTDFSFTINAGDDLWDAGPVLFVITDGNRNPITFVSQPQLTVTGALCQFVTASLSPGSAIVNGSSPGPLSQPVTLSLTTTNGCAQLSTQFTPGGSPAQSLALTGSAPSYSLVLPSSLTWSTGLKAFAFTDVTGGGVPLRNEQSVNLDVSVQCAITVALNPNPVKRKGSALKSNVTVTATPATGADCTGLAVTYAFPGGSSTQPMVLQGSGVYQYTINASTDTWAVGSFEVTFASDNTPDVGTSPSPVNLIVTN